MDLKKYIAALWRRKWIVLITPLLAATVAVLGTAQIIPTYESVVTLRIATAAGGAVDYMSHDTLYADRLLNTYSKIATSRPILQEVAAYLHIDEVPDVAAEIPANTELLQITVQSSDPNLAERTANTLASILETHINDLAQSDGQEPLMTLANQVVQAQQDLEQARDQYAKVGTPNQANQGAVDAAKRNLDLKEKTYAMLLEQFDRARAASALRNGAISIVEPAVASESPIRPKGTLNLALGVVLGIVGGIGLAFFFEYLDPRLHTIDQIRTTTEMQIVGTVPELRKRDLRQFPALPVFHEEAFRRLRTNILATDSGTQLCTLLVTSAEPNEGKSTIAARLAVAIAQSGHSVAIVDCDVRLPQIHTLFALSNEQGLSDVLLGKTALSDALHDTSVESLSVLPSGENIQAVTLFDSRQMETIMQQLQRQFDYVVLDSPSLLAVADAALLAPLVDGVVLVVRRSRVQQDAVQEAHQQLARVRSTIIGIVVNGTDQYPRYGHYYRSQFTKGTRDLRH